MYIFSAVGIEPWGRIATGIAEGIAAIMLLVPRTILYGALMGAGIMLGAVATHLFILGIAVMNDGGQLFIYALLVMGSCIILIFQHRHELLQLKTKLLP